MNYFERLIRRALLEAPARAGDALRDPFENAAPMAFDTPAQPPASPWPQRAPAETSAALSPPPAPNADASRIASTARRVTDVEALRGATPLPPPEASAWSSRQDEPSPAVIAPGPVSVPLSASLAQADAFMRGIGAAMPEALSPPSSLPSIEPDPAVPSRVSPAHEDARIDGMPTDGMRIEGARDAVPATTRNPATIQPPPPRLPTPEAASRARAEPAAAPAAQTQASPTTRERASPPRTVTEVVRETVHVVRVADPDVVRGAQQGASPPAFGAGQL
jgi:hypothetical protein